MDGCMDGMAPPRYQTRFVYIHRPYGFGEDAVRTSGKEIHYRRENGRATAYNRVIPRKNGCIVIFPVGREEGEFHY